MHSKKKKKEKPSKKKCFPPMFSKFSLAFSSENPLGAADKRMRVTGEKKGLVNAHSNYFYFRPPLSLFFHALCVEMKICFNLKNEHHWLLN